MTRLLSGKVETNPAAGHLHGAEGIITKGCQKWQLSSHDELTNRASCPLLLFCAQRARFSNRHFSGSSNLGSHSNICDGIVLFSEWRRRVQRPFAVTTTKYHGGDSLPNNDLPPSRGVLLTQPHPLVPDYHHIPEYGKQRRSRAVWLCRQEWENDSRVMGIQAKQ